MANSASRYGRKFGVLKRGHLVTWTGVDGIIANGGRGEISFLASKAPLVVTQKRKRASLLEIE
jgi:hypothetical protein